MGIPEAMYGLGAAILLAVIVYATMVAGRRRRTPVSDAATRRNFDKE